ncbi:MAG: hypothetical protein V3U20_04370 [Thermoplasmata archaeon]
MQGKRQERFATCGFPMVGHPFLEERCANNSPEADKYTGPGSPWIFHAGAKCAVQDFDNQAQEQEVLPVKTETLRFLRI